MLELPYLKAVQTIFNASIPETNPRIVKLPSYRTRGIEISLLPGITVTAVVDSEGWGVIDEETAPKITAIAPLNTDSGEVAYILLVPFVYGFMNHLFPEPGTIDIEAVMNGLGEGTREYKLFMNILRFFMMLRDGVIFEDNQDLHQMAHNMIEWLGNRQSFSG